MTGRHPAAMRKRDESSHWLIKDALAKGYLNTGKIYLCPILPDHPAANEGRLSVNRASTHLGYSTPCWVITGQGNRCDPAKDPCPDPQTPHRTVFRLYSLNRGRKHVLDETGGDPSKMKYNPFQRSEGPIADADGRHL